MEYRAGIFKNSEYVAVEFVEENEKDIACNHCAFELGKCQPAILKLGQCYIKEGDEVIVNIYYRVLKEKETNKSHTEE